MSEMGKTRPAPPRRVGRPPGPNPRKPKGGKGSQLSANITEELRAALEAEAERTGRSLSQVAELWMELGRARAIEQRALETNLAAHEDLVRRYETLAQALRECGLTQDWAPNVPLDARC